MRFLWWFICYNEDILVGTKEVVGQDNFREH